ncbi:MAG: alpha/beta hydrolase family protein [Candidatus Velthaea sp.]
MFRARSTLVISAIALTLATSAFSRFAAFAGPSGNATDFAKQIDIGGGRKLYLVCRGTVRVEQPTVILVSGYHDSSDPWIQPEDLSLLPQSVGPSTLVGLARTNHVCAYDRPGTLRYITGLPLTARSSPVTQPRTVKEIALELHTLLAVAKVPGPYILVGHSLGGLIVLFYARTYPNEVRGIVFVDAFSPTVRTRLGSLWPLYRKVLNPPPADEPIASLKEAASETVDLDKSIDEVQAAPPLRKMPLGVLTKTEPFRIRPGSLPPGITLSEIDNGYNGAQNYLVELAPTTPQIFATGSEHYIQLSQPDLVINATQLVIRRATAQTR